MAKKRKGSRLGGRPPAGLKGEKISEAYPTVTIRVPPEIREQMSLAQRVLNQPLWKILVKSFKAYLGDGEVLDDDGRADMQYARRRASEKAKRAKHAGEQ